MTSRLHDRLGNHVVAYALSGESCGDWSRKSVRLVVEGLCELLMFPGVFGGVQPGTVQHDI